MDYENFSDDLFVMTQAAKRLKETSFDSDTARHWAVLRTELEKCLAYYDTFLKPKPFSEGDSK